MLRPHECDLDNIIDCTHKVTIMAYSGTGKDVWPPPETWPFSSPVYNLSCATAIELLLSGTRNLCPRSGRQPGPLDYLAAEDRSVDLYLSAGHLEEGPAFLYADRSITCGGAYERAEIACPGGLSN